mmetsp:Transcript_11959/g.20593  ORF Transcript_11959/g.20593 Transcript_11959/m.20593 type:complete len:87 (+) Transcript_11959:170-430(+)
MKSCLPTKRTENRLHHSDAKNHVMNRLLEFTAKTIHDCLTSEPSMSRMSKTDEGTDCQNCHEDEIHDRTGKVTTFEMIVGVQRHWK